MTSLTRLPVRARIACGAALLAACAAAPAVARAQPALRGSMERHSFSSAALAGTIHYSVYLPPGYAGSSESYPVIYFLHGLPSNGAAYRAIRWVGHAVEQSGREAIVVGAQGARHGDTDPEWLDWGGRRNWERATAGELVRAVDGRYRTIADRSGRAIIGYSAGGYGATLIGFHHPGEFSVIESWSGYFEPTNPAGTAVLDLGSRKANTHASMHALVPGLRRRLGRYYGRTYFGFYVGSRDKRFRPDNDRLHHELVRSGFRDFNYAVYAGGHAMTLWESQAPRWIGRALGRLARPQANGGAPAG